MEQLLKKKIHQSLSRIQYQQSANSCLKGSQLNSQSHNSVSDSLLKPFNNTADQCTSIASELKHFPSGLQSSRSEQNLSHILTFFNQSDPNSLSKKLLTNNKFSPSIPLKSSYIHRYKSSIKKSRIATEVSAQTNASKNSTKIQTSIRDRDSQTSKHQQRVKAIQQMLNYYQHCKDSSGSSVQECENSKSDSLNTSVKSEKYLDSKKSMKKCCQLQSKPKVKKIPQNHKRNSDKIRCTEKVEAQSRINSREKKKCSQQNIQSLRTKKKCRTKIYSKKCTPLSSANKTPNQCVSTTADSEKNTFLSRSLSSLKIEGLHLSDQKVYFGEDIVKKSGPSCIPLTQSHSQSPSFLRHQAEPRFKVNLPHRTFFKKDKVNPHQKIQDNEALKFNCSSQLQPGNHGSDVADKKIGFFQTKHENTKLAQSQFSKNEQHFIKLYDKSQFQTGKRLSKKQRTYFCKQDSINLLKAKDVRQKFTLSFEELKRSSLKKKKSERNGEENAESHNKSCMIQKYLIL